MHCQKVYPDMSGEDDFQVSGGKSKGSGKEGEKEDVRVPCESFLLTPLMGFLQPCPLVFFRDGWGDYEIFRFLWFRMPYQLHPLKLESRSNNDTIQRDDTAERVAAMSLLHWPGEAIPGGFAAKAWAFRTLAGDFVLAIYAESDSAGKQALYFRGDCNEALDAIQRTSKATAAALLPQFVAVP